MINSKHFISLLFAWFAVITNISAQTQKDTIYTLKSPIPVVVDGSDKDSIWSESEWHDIHQVWIPYNATMTPGDFEGRFKVAWDSAYLYVLVDVIDDVLSDDHSNPLQNWWDDDCVEVFIDENRSGGDHERNNNAFAYHVSIFYDAIDMDANGNGVNYKRNLTVVMDTIGPHEYMWEMAIKMYSATFSLSNPEASRVWLSKNKLMGFSIAYCDNDNGTTRENFIGSVYMTAATANDSYKNASYFGTMLLVEPEVATGLNSVTKEQSGFKLFPNPASEYFILKNYGTEGEIKNVRLQSLTGSLVRTWNSVPDNHRFETKGLAAGIYFLSFSVGSELHTGKLLIQ